MRTPREMVLLAGVLALSLPHLDVRAGSNATATKGGAESLSLRLLRDKGVITDEEYGKALKELEELTPAPDPARLDVKAELGKGVAFAAPSKRFSMVIRPRLQLRGSVVMPTEGTAGTKEFSVRRARIGFNGNVLNPKLTYTVVFGIGVADMESGVATPLLDANVGYALFRDLNILLGQYQIPLDRIGWSSAFTVQFVDRSPVMSELSADRDVGLTLSSKDLFGLDGRLQYALGIYNGLGRNRLTNVFELPDPKAIDPENDDGFMPRRFDTWRHLKPNVFLLARFQVNPMGSFNDLDEGDLKRLPTPKLSVGGAVGYLQNAQRPRGTLGEFFKLGGYDYYYGVVDGVFKWAGFSLLGQVMTRYSDRKMREGIVNKQPVTEHSRSATALLLQSGYMLTNHLEVAGRIGELVPWKDTDPKLRRQHELATAVSWYFLRHDVKLQADYAYFFGDKPDKGNHQVRVQVFVAP